MELYIYIFGGSKPCMGVEAMENKLGNHGRVTYFLGVRTMDGGAVENRLGSGWSYTYFWGVRTMDGG